MVAEVVGQTKVPTVGKAPPRDVECIDSVKASVVVDESLDADFFRHIVDHKDDTLNGGHPDRKTVQQIEPTSNCVSNYQGEQLMPLCNATLMSGGGVGLAIVGGQPEFTSALTAKIDEKKQFTCGFDFILPTPFEGTLQWNVTRKTLRLKKDEFKAGEHLFGWLSVEFEEIHTFNGKETRQSYKVEGYIKPVIQPAAAQGR